MTKSATSVLRRIACRLRSEEGVTLVIVLGVMVVTSLIVLAVFTSTNGEIHLTATDTSQKKAYYAAEAGVQDYEYHLTEDGNYLAYCTEPSPKNEALNQYYKTPAGAESLKPAELKTVEVPELEALKPGEEPHSEERYAIQLIPAKSDKIAGDKQCDTKHLVETMVEEEGAATGTFRIKSVGFSGNSVAEIVATFRNANFVSYVWYTVYEVPAPAVYGAVPSGKPANYFTECTHYYFEREALAAKQCETEPTAFNNYFGTGESIMGPVHVEDHVGICGSPVFGRYASDRIEFGNGNNREEAGATGYSAESCGGSDSPTFKGSHIPPKEVPTLPPPPGDEELSRVVEESYHYYGKTEIVLEGKTMTVNKYEVNPTTKAVEIKSTPGVALPPGGVIYVSNAKQGTCPAYSPFGPVPSYTEDTACGNVYVHGHYELSLTIAAENDVIINGNILTPTSPEDKPNAVPTTNALLGLIANNFVRIYHPLKGVRGSKYRECKVGSGAEATNLEAEENGVKPDLKEPIIYAAMLAVKQEIIVDNFDCGAANLGHLNVYGTLAGLYTNGFTGIINSGDVVEHGYGYNAEYDNRLQIEEPPHFLNPIQAAWYIQRQTLAKAP